jgi:hypothetical protein
MHEVSERSGDAFPLLGQSSRFQGNRAFVDVTHLCERELCEALYK